MRTQQQRYNFHPHAALIEFHPAIPGGKYVVSYYSVTIWLNAAFGNTEHNKKFQEIKCKRTFQHFETAYKYAERLCKGAQPNGEDDESSID